MDYRENKYIIKLEEEKLNRLKKRMSYFPDRILI